MLSQFKWPFLFVSILVGLFFFYDYDDSSFKRPQSVHYWRQADCASLTLNYYQNGMNFFQPVTHNLTSDNFTTGYTSTSEMPLLYYSVALLYHVFGYHEFVYRLFNLLIFFTGLFYLYKLFYNLIKHQFWAMCLPLLLFSSPVLAYYANNFLSNSAALGIVFIGWYHFMEYYKSKKAVSFKKAMIFFAIAGLLKITALLSLGAIIGIYLFEKLFPDNRNNIFSKGVAQLSAFALVLGIIGAWTAYASYYNDLHVTSYFSTTIFPVWRMSGDQIFDVVDHVMNQWFGQYFNVLLWGFLLLCFLAIILLQKGVNKTFLRLTFILVLGSWAYIALQFATFQDHDYYTLNLFIIPVFILITIIDLINTHFPKILKSKIVLVLMFSFTLFNLNYAATQLDLRYYGWRNNDGIKNDLEDITPYLRTIGIKRTDKVISIPDESHLSLYLMNQPGWTEYAERFFNQREAVYLNHDNEGMDKSIANGAKYLILNGLNELYTRPFLQEYAVHLIGMFREVFIFDLTKMKDRNFVLPNRTVKQILVCNAESLGRDEEYFEPLHGSFSFAGTSARSKEHSYSGDYSVKLNSENEYGMTLVIDSVKYGESFIVSVIRKKGGTPLQLIASGQGKPAFYYNEVTIGESVDVDWDVLKMSFHIPKNMDGRPLLIYLWNPGSVDVYADDLKVVWFNSYFK